VSESLGALTPLAARNGNQPANRLVRRHYVAKEQKEAVERRRVLLVGPGRVAIGQHDDAIVEHHRITCCGFAAHVSGRACDQQCVDAAAHGRALLRLVAPQIASNANLRSNDTQVIYINQQPKSYGRASFRTQKGAPHSGNRAHIDRVAFGNRRQSLTGAPALDGLGPLEW